MKSNPPSLQAILDQEPLYSTDLIFKRLADALVRSTVVDHHAKTLQVLIHRLCATARQRGNKQTNICINIAVALLNEAHGDPVVMAELRRGMAHFEKQNETGGDPKRD